MSLDRVEPRMFHHIDKTWNPVIGCLHNCTYCWARRLTETRLKDMEKYKDGFKPKLCDYELKKSFKKKFVFVADMGDMFGDWVPREWITKVLASIKSNPSSYFLFLTKNPKRYKEFLNEFPPNVVLGATIETNREYTVSKTPARYERYKSMADLTFKNKLVCIEPVMDFDPDIFAQWIKEICPAIVYIGYDNYKNGLPEPSLTKTKDLIKRMQTYTQVSTKTLREANQTI
jgi:DNA repair photolyase